MKRPVGISERIYLWVEVFILTRLVGVEHPGTIFKWLFKLPILIYQVGLGRLIGRQILLLFTIGRKTGKKRATPLEYAFDPQSLTYRVMAGWGGRTDWYRNALANPHVQVRVGTRSFDALAEPLPDEDVAEIMMQITRENPRMLRIWSRWAGAPVEATLESMLQAARHFPSLNLREVL